MRMRLLKESDPFDYWLLRQTSSRPQSVVLLLRRRTTGAKSVPKVCYYSIRSVAIFEFDFSINNCFPGDWQNFSRDDISRLLTWVYALKVSEIQIQTIGQLNVSIQASVRRGQQEAMQHDVPSVSSKDDTMPTSTTLNHERFSAITALDNFVKAPLHPTLQATGRDIGYTR